MLVLTFAVIGALVGSIVGPPLLGGSIGLVLGGSLGLARRPTRDGDVLRVLGICVVVFGATGAFVLRYVSHLHVCLQPWTIVFDFIDFNGRTHRCLAWWTGGRTVILLLDSLCLGALLLAQSARAATDSPRSEEVMPERPVTRRRRVTPGARRHGNVP